jgi:hypothetical protein
MTKSKITPAQLRLLRWYAEGRIDYPPRGKAEPLQRAGYLTPGWGKDVTSAGLALLASTPEPRAAVHPDVTRRAAQLDREIAPKKSPAQLDAEIAEALQGKPTKPARLSKAARMKLGAALRRAIQNEKILTGAYRSMRHDDYQRAGEAAIEASGLYGRAAAQASDDGVEIFEIVDGAPHVDQGALVRWDEEP